MLARAMTGSLVVYRVREGASPEAERSTLAEAYRFLLEIEKKGSPETAPDDATGGSSDSGAKRSILR